MYRERDVYIYIYTHMHMYIYIYMYGGPRWPCIHATQALLLLASRIPDMPNIHNILTIIGHRVGHQSGLGESSGRKFDNLSASHCVPRLFSVFRSR